MCSSLQSSSGYRSAGQSQIHKEFLSLKINDRRGYCAPGTRLNDKPKTQLWKVSNTSDMKEKCNIHGVLAADYSRSVVLCSRFGPMMEKFDVLSLFSPISINVVNSILFFFYFVTMILILVVVVWE